MFITTNDMSQPTINLVCVCDNHYGVLLATLIKSIEVNHHTEENIAIYVVNDGISQKSIAKLLRSIKSEKIHLHLIKISEAIPEASKLPMDKSTYPMNIYTRFFIPNFLPDHVEKVIYMDVDMILLKDISILWHMDMKEYLLGAVQDMTSPTFGVSWGGIPNYKELGFSAETKHLNSGMLLINTKKWREQNIVSQLLNVMNENLKYAAYPDQYAINVLFADNWLEIDTSWNAYVDRPHQDPSLLHYIHRKPIYTTYAHLPEYKDLFFTYLNQTEWKGMQLIGEASRYQKKISNVVKKFSLIFK
ncbi:MAG: glycosyltransferase family 8 protein [Verrucomicrobia bacterium]|nr:glycosyltransferase family 8 protein [Cytophagales bacterium]